MDEYDFNVKLSKIEVLSTWRKISGEKRCCRCYKNHTTRMTGAEICLSPCAGDMELGYRYYGQHYSSIILCLPEEFANNIIIT